MFREESDYDICPICRWKNDGVQRNDFDYWGGANDLSVHEAQLLFSLSKNKHLAGQLNTAAITYENKIKSIYQKYEDINITTSAGENCRSELRKAHDDYVARLHDLREMNDPQRTYTSAY
jgi:hypothetical protein